MFPRSSLKACLNWYTWLLNPFSRIYAGLTPKTAYLGTCRKGQILLEFSLTWIRLIRLLAFPMPWDCLDFTFHYPFEKLYKELYSTLKAYERIERKETIVHCYRNLCLSLHPFVPWSIVVFFPSLPFASELAIWVMEDWVGGGPSGGFCFSGLQTCRHRLSLLISDSY